jgi:hypothetical protein
LENHLKAELNVSPISVAGGYWTGSSAIIDLLAEHERCTAVPAEFTLFSFGQFFSEVFEPLLQGSTDYGLFDLNVRRMRDFNRSDVRPLRPIIRRLLTYIRHYPISFFNPRSDMFKKLGPDYEKCCKALLKQLVSIKDDPSSANIAELKYRLSSVLLKAALGATEHTKQSSIKYGVFDQLVAPPFIRPAQLAIPELKHINVDRDWRDQYVSMRGRYLHMMARNKKLGLRPFDENLGIVDRLPIDFMSRLRKRIDETRRFQALNPQKNVLWLDYEDIVLNSEKTAKKVFDFLDLDPGQWKSNQFFFPEKSKNRIGKWNRGDWLRQPLKGEIDELAERLGVPVR